MVFLRAVLVFALLVVPVGAQTSGPIRIHTVGPIASPDGGSIPTGTVMADSGPVTTASNWAVMYMCSGAPKPEGVTVVGGDGVYVYERYNVTTTFEPVQVVHTAFSQGGPQSAPGPIKIAAAVDQLPILVVHRAMYQGGTQSIPPIALQAGEGLRIRTAAPLRGILSCVIWMYIFG